MRHGLHITLAVLLVGVAATPVAMAGHKVTQSASGGSKQQSGELSSSQNKQGAETIRGEVIAAGEVLPLDADEYYLVKDTSGKEIRLFAGDSRKGVKVGDRIEAKVSTGGKVQSIRKLEPSQSKQ